MARLERGALAGRAAAAHAAPMAVAAAPTRPRAARRAPMACPAVTERAAAAPKFQRPDANGRYGKFGGRYVPETLIPALEELMAAYTEAKADPAYQARGRPRSARCAVVAQRDGN